MEKIIEQLILLDNNAKAIVSKSEEKLQNLPFLVDGEAKNAASEIETQALKEIKNVIAAAEETIRLNTEKTNAELDERLESLEALRLSHKDIWAKEIADYVLKSYSV